MGPTWGPPGSCRPQMGPMLAPWTLLFRDILPMKNHMIYSARAESDDISYQCWSRCYICQCRTMWYILLIIPSTKKDISILLPSEMLLTKIIKSLHQPCQIMICLLRKNKCHFVLYPTKISYRMKNDGLIRCQTRRPWIPFEIGNSHEKSHSVWWSENVARYFRANSLAGLHICSGDEWIMDG